MLRIADTRTGRLAEIPPGHRHLLRICVHLPGIDAATDTTSAPAIGAAHLRAPLVGDVLARAAELHGLQAVTVLTAPDLPDERARALDRAMGALGIHPPAAVDAHDATGSPGAPADVHLFAHGTGSDTADAGDGARIDVGGVNAPIAIDLGLEGADPLAVRMLLLGHAHSVPVTVTLAALAETGRFLGHWRQQVADWAREPSRPIPADLLQRAYAALDDNLGVPAVLELLVGLARDSDVPGGAKFETFAHLDRVLGLDLAREVGRQPKETR
ncbi:hypothetical protein FBY35_0588 [Streptomyces sp. SLBN-118]|uniref:hypothetical protein n=1 Tax=Streptomyces sp. SLBN-118 TaxID=2768454 RepID=UPI001154B717|nr:hypothetical protein [Streptomyces sp. SLBN-118]TQK50264.1 hypothetical protein FBY35_0588 [Streptomyces sp. SLBN-118]